MAKKKHIQLSWIDKHPWLMRLLGVGVLMACAWAMYHHVMHSDFHMDDFFFIKGNPGIRDFSQWQKFGDGVISNHSRYLVFATYALNYALHKMDLFGYHLFNLGVHLFSALSVWWLAFIVFDVAAKDHRTRIYDNRLMLSFCVALLFIAHPVQTQAITYISQRFESMATLFYLLTTASYLWARLKVRGLRQCIFYGIAALSAVAAVNCKEVSITLPIMILFVEMALVQRDFSIKKFMTWLWNNKIILVILLAILIFIPYKFGFKIQGQLFAIKESGSHEGDQLSFLTYQMTQWRVWLKFLQLLIVPIGQNLDHDFPMSTGLFSPPMTIVSLGVIIGLFLASIKARKKYPGVFIGMMWFFITMSVSLIPRRHLIFEHKLYLVSFGFFLTCVWLLAEHVTRKTVQAIIVIILSVVLGVMTYQRNNVWQTELSLWSDAVKKSPNKYRPNLNTGKSYLEMGDLDNALIYLNRAGEINKASVEVFNNRGLLYHKRKEYDKALADFAMAEKIEPKGSAEVHNNRGVLYKDTGRLDEALEEYKKALKLNPLYAEIYNNMGVVYRKKGMQQEAVAEFSKALTIQPKYPDAFVNLANVYRDLGQAQKALDYYNRAIALNANNPIYFANRANTYLDLGQPELALRDYNRAIQLNPQMPVLWMNRGLFLQKKGRFAEAVSDYERALQIDDNYILARHNLSVAYRLLKKYDQAIAQGARVIAQNPMLAQAYNNIIFCLWESGNKDGAAKYYEQSKANGLTLDPRVINMVEQNKKEGFNND